MTPELRADAARNRERVLAAARRRVDAGDLTLPMNSLAAEAGVGVGTAYRHFRDRAALVAALAAPRLEELREDARAAADGPDAVAAVTTLLRSVMRALMTDRALAEAMRLGPEGVPELADDLADMSRLVDGLLTRARDEGAPVMLRADDLRRLLCGVEHAAHLGDDPLADAARYVDMLFPGLRGA